MIAIAVDDDLGHLAEERAGKTELAPEARRPAQDHAQDVIAPLVAGDDAVAHEKGDAAAVIGDDAVGVWFSRACSSLCPRISCRRAKIGKKRSVS